LRGRVRQRDGFGKKFQGQGIADEVEVGALRQLRRIQRAAKGEECW
jgi:hypothetical protein